MLGRPLPEILKLPVRPHWRDTNKLGELAHLWITRYDHAKQSVPTSVKNAPMTMFIFSNLIRRSRSDKSRLMMSVSTKADMGRKARLVKLHKKI